MERGLFIHAWHINLLNGNLKKNLVILTNLTIKIKEILLVVLCLIVHSWIIKKKHIRLAFLSAFLILKYALFLMLKCLFL